MKEISPLGCETRGVIITIAALLLLPPSPHSSRGPNENKFSLFSAKTNKQTNENHKRRTQTTEQLNGNKI